MRDALLHRACDDVDIACSATWEQSESVFTATGCSCYRTGVKHGTLTVKVDGSLFEITSYRSDGTYSDGRHPDQVKFVKSIEEDLARRDFTINAMAYHPTRGLLDPYHGRDDLDSRLIRCVGCANRRFSEDALRILRAARFESQLGFSLEAETAHAMLALAPGLHHVAVERQLQEWNKLLCGTHVRTCLMDNIDMLGIMIPELLPMKGFDQRTPFHCYDVLEHTAYVVELVDSTPRQRWAALLHDIGKPEVFTVDKNGQGHFKGHPAASETIAKKVTKRFKMSKDFSRDVVQLVALHDIGLIARPNEVKRAIMRFNNDPELFRDLCKLKRADAIARTTLYGRPRVQKAEDLLACLDHVLKSNEPYCRAMLAIDGSDLITLGMQPGPQVGKVLDFLLDATIDAEVPNTREALLAFASTHLQEAAEI